MENPFGISEEDFDSFEDLSNDMPEAISQLITQLTTSLDGLIDSEEWLVKANKIACVPNLVPQVKIACMFIGPGPILGQLFLLHFVVTNEYTAPEALGMFRAYGLLMGMSIQEISQWVGMYFTLAVLTQNDADAEIVQGPLAEYLHTHTEMRTEAMLTALGMLQPHLEQYGVVFTEDSSLLQEHLVVPIENLAPDV